MFYKIKSVSIPRDGAILEENIDPFIEKDLAAGFMSDPNSSLIDSLERLYDPTVIVSFFLEKIDFLNVASDDFFVALYLRKEPDRKALTLPELKPLVVRDFLIFAR